MLINSFHLFGSVVLISLGFDLTQAERRYCGLALTKKLISVCESTDCKQIEKNDDDQHIDEISTRCCRFGCTTSHIEQFCCLSSYTNEKSETSTPLSETPFRPKKNSDKHSTLYYKNLRFKQMKSALENWAEIKLDSLV